MSMDFAGYSFTLTLFGKEFTGDSLVSPEEALTEATLRLQHSAEWKEMVENTMHQDIECKYLVATSMPSVRNTGNETLREERQAKLMQHLQEERLESKYKQL